MAPIPKDEPVQDIEDISDAENDGNQVAMYGAGISDSSDGEESGFDGVPGGYVMLSQESGSAVSDDENESTPAGMDCTVVVDADRLLRSLDAQDQMSFARSSACDDGLTTKDTPHLPSVWSKTVVQGVSTSSEQAATIMAAMKGFSLPEDSIPTWASTVPEAVWKEQLISRIRCGSSMAPAGVEPS